MTKAQNTYYWSLWGKLRKVDPKADRHALHAQLGLPESHTVWNNEHFDAWKAHCLAITQPANFPAQLGQVKMPATRKRVFIRQLLAAMGESDEYAESTIARMQRNRRLVSTGAGSMLTLDTLQPLDLEKLMIALKKECRRRWKTKDHLLGEIQLLIQANDFQEDMARSAILQALCKESLPPLDKLYYEPLLVVLGVLRTLADSNWTAITRLIPEPVLSTAPAAAEEPEEIDIPF